MNRELNIVLRLAEHPSNASEAGKLNAMLEKRLQDMRNIEQQSLNTSREIQNLTRQEIALVGELNKAYAEGRNFDAERIEEALGGVRDEITTLIEKNQDLGDSYDATAERAVDAYQRIQKHAERTQREVDVLIDRQGKQYQKLFGAVAKGFHSVTSLAKSAALAYASVMDTDDETVKEWMQWFAAIESVSQAISGVYGSYKAITDILKTLQSLRKIDAALTTAQAAAEVALATARARSSAAGGIPVPGGGGLPAAPVAGGIGKMLMTGLGWTAAAVGTFAVASEASSWLFHGESFWGNVGEAWSARSSMKDSEARVQRQQRTKEVADRIYTKERFSPEAIYERNRREAEGVAESGSQVAGLLGRSGERETQLIGSRAELEASMRASAFMRDRAESMATNPMGLPEAAQMAVDAANEEIRQLQMVIDLRRQEQALAMETQQERLRSLEAEKSGLQAQYDFFKSLRESAERELAATTRGLLSASPAEARRGLAAREKLDKDSSYALNYREAQAMEAAGLVHTDAQREAVQAAYTREAQRRFGRMAGGQIIGELAQETEALKEQEGAAKEDLKSVKADVNVQQEIMVKLEQAQATEIDELVKVLQPKLEELLRERNEMIAKKMDEMIKRAALQQAQGMSDDEQKNILTGGTKGP